MELKLKKLSPGKWEALEGSGEDKVHAINAVPSAEEGAAAASSAPKSVYSGSSRDWDAIDSDLKQQVRVRVRVRVGVRVSVRVRVGVRVRVRVRIVGIVMVIVMVG